MKRRIFALFLMVLLFIQPVEALKWVDFGVPYESLRYALDRDMETAEQEPHTGWIEILALAASRTGGRCGLESVKQAAKALGRGEDPTGQKHYAYYHRAFTAVLGGLVGSYAIEIDGKWVPAYGLKAFSPIAAGYG